jgi:hypothetical protein
MAADNLPVVENIHVDPNLQDNDWDDKEDNDSESSSNGLSDSVNSIIQEKNLTITATK